MAFDFTNYTFSAMIAFVAMVIGMSYPLVLQAVHRITETYHDDYMSMRFTREQIYRYFEINLIVAVGVGFVMPFLLYVMNGMHCTIASYILLCSQAIVTFSLLVHSVLLYKLIMTYYNSNDLLNHVAKNKEEFLPQCVKILLRSAESGNRDTYREAVRRIFERIWQYQKDFYQGGKRRHNPMEYIPACYDAMDKIVEGATQKDRYDFLYKENPYAELFYNYMLDVVVSKNTMKHFWSYINRIVEAECYEWF